MARILKVRPTKIELVKLKRRLTLSRRVKKILNDRLAILMMAFIDTARRAIEARRRLVEARERADKAMTIARGFHGAIALEKELCTAAADITLGVSTKNIAGARIPVLTLNIPDDHGPRYDLAATSSLVDDAADAGREVLHAIIALAELQRSLELMGAEIRRTKRIANALEYLVIPSLDETVRSLSMKFEERDREEKARLKHVKVLLARSAGN